jgi:hypothetical protein
MTTTYTWSFPHLEVAPSLDGLTNVVKTVHWRIMATEDGHSAEAYGSVSLSDPDPDTFTAFDGLTKETVQGWVEATLNAEGEGEVLVVERMKTSLAEQIARAKAPPVVTMPAPWS